MRKIQFSLIFLGLLFYTNIIKAQQTDGMTGLLHMVNAEIQKDATFMLGGNMLHKNNVPSKLWWGDYNTYNYYINITLFDRIEMASFIGQILLGESL